MPEDVLYLVRKANLLQTLFTEAEGVTYKGHKYVTGGAVILHAQSLNYVFGEIISVFIINAQPYLLCNDLNIVDLNCHYNAYQVGRNQKYSLKQVHTEGFI